MPTSSSADSAGGGSRRPAVKAAGLSDVGRKRKGNEDAFLLDDALNLYLVADGMGGRNAGEVASRLVVETIGRTLRGLKGKECLKTVMTPLPGLSEAANRLVYSVLVANRETFDFASEHPECKGMGSTVSAVHFSEDRLIVCNVGDSPVFRFREGEPETLSIPHTVMAEQEALAQNGGFRLGKQYLHMITRAMGVGQTVQPDVKELHWQPGDVLVICSDGLSDKTFPEEIGDIVLNHDPETACRDLVALANDRGGDDNVTVIVLKIDPPPDTPAARPADGSLIAGEPEPPAATKRTDAGKPENPHVIIEYDTEEASYTAITRNLRLDGVFIETTEPFIEGEDLLLNITDPATEETIMVSGIVMNRNARGVDIVFDDLNGAQFEEIKRLVRKL
ncbi:MAG: PP2C family protein-serine/threonine phosphatase [Desulfobacterales bacterium]